MKIFFMGNNWVGWQTLQWLKEHEEQVVGLAIHPEGMSKYGAEILEAARLPEDCVFDGSTLDDPEVIERVRALDPDIGVSVYLGYILRPAFIDLFPGGCINLHPSYLPYNRGVHPNVWSIVEGTPAGVTIHLIDPGVDTGAILARDLVEVEPVDTGETLYHKLEKACVDLFRRTWPSIREGTAVQQSQADEEGTSHRVSDLSMIDRIELDQTCTARELIDLIRAMTFPPHSGAFFDAEGRRVHLRLELEYGQESEE
ncbi:methionyl-tRNA formyltransferase [Gemmatimonadota bacterium]